MHALFMVRHLERQSVLELKKLVANCEMRRWMDINIVTLLISLLRYVTACPLIINHSACYRSDSFQKHILPKYSRAQRFKSGTTPTQSVSSLEKHTFAAKTSRPVVFHHRP